MEIHRSARKHGVADADILHAIDHVLAFEDADPIPDDPGQPDRWLIIGPDQAGNLLEVVVMETVEGDQVVIHAMPMQTKFRRLLP